MGLGSYDGTSAEVRMQHSMLEDFNWCPWSKYIWRKWWSAASAGFIISAGGQTNGFSFTGGVIPAGSNGVLTNLSGSFPEIYVYLLVLDIADATGALDATFGEYMWFCWWMGRSWCWWCMWWRRWLCRWVWWVWCL